MRALVALFSFAHKITRPARKITNCLNSPPPALVRNGCCPVLTSVVVAAAGSNGGDSLFQQESSTSSALREPLGVLSGFRALGFHDYKHDDDDDDVSATNVNRVL